MERGLKKYIGKICEGFVFRANNKETRDLLVKRLNRIPFSEYEFVDATSEQLNNMGMAFFLGTNPKNNETFGFTISFNPELIHNKLILTIN